MVKSFVVVSPALIGDGLARGGGDETLLATASCQTTTFCVPAGTFLISKFPFVVGHGEVGVVEDHPVGLHPGMDVAGQLAGRPLGLR